MLVDIDFDEKKLLEYYSKFKYSKIFVTNTDEEKSITLGLDDVEHPFEVSHGFIPISKGIYYANSLANEMLGILYGGRHNFFEYEFELAEFLGEDRLKFIMKYPNAHWYGIADSVEQILEHPGIKKFFIDDPDKKVILTVQEFIKKEGAGFRWHKNGPYIGVQERHCESFENEPEIEKVVMFQFKMLKPER